MSLTRRNDNVPQSSTGVCLLSVEKVEETPEANVTPSANVANTSDSEQSAAQRCKCQYLWMHEVHGVPALMMSRSSEERLLWALIIIICGLVAFYNTNTMLRNYVQKRSATKIAIVPVRSIEFPAFIFCPKNADALNYTALENAFCRGNDVHHNRYNVLYQRARIGPLDNSTAIDLLRYVVAGSGFDNFHGVIKAWNDSYLAKLTRLYNVWRGNKSVLEMFNFVFQENGYTCEDFFHICWLGPLTLNCCEIFVPTFVLMRGRCFRLADGHYQTNLDEAGKLVVFLNQVKGRLAGKKNTPELIMYIGDTYQEVGLSPRFYLMPHSWNRFRLTQKRFSMLPDNPECSTKPLDQGMATCYVHRFLHKVVIAPFNCTFPYFKGMLPYLNSTLVCDPLIILQDYARITNTNIESGCVAACKRVVNVWDMETSTDLSKHKAHTFRVEASFTDLEYEQFSEVPIVTLAGFISELGGQSGLFMGCSFPSYVQLFVLIGLLCYTFTTKIWTKYIA